MCRSMGVLVGKGHSPATPTRVFLIWDPTDQIHLHVHELRVKARPAGITQKDTWADERVSKFRIQIQSHQFGLCLYLVGSCGSR